MSLAAVDPFDDPRVAHRFSDVNGHSYHFLYAEPHTREWRATAFLIHGWPDLSLAWRHQIPLLLSLGLRVVCPDMMGYGRTSAPRVPPNPLSLYSFKRASDDIRELARQLGSSTIILGGHDWGGAITYRCAQWHPNFVTHVFSVCTPFSAPTKRYVSLEDHIARAQQSQLQYQLHLAGPEVEATIKSPEEIRQFLNGMYGARGAHGETLFDPCRGILLENLPKIGRTKLLTDREMDYYVEEYSRNGLHSTVNWYRTRKTNFDDELSLPLRGIDVPVLFICATNDSVLLPSMSLGMDRHIPRLTRREVKAGHWALWQAKDAVNAHIKEWIESVVFGKSSKL